MFKMCSSGLLNGEVEEIYVSYGGTLDNFNKKNNFGKNHYL